MLKKMIQLFLFALILFALSVNPSFALSESTALKKAKTYVPKTAQLRSSEKKGSFYEFEFRSADKKIDYEILITSKNTLAAKEIEYRKIKGGTSFKITADKAKQNVKKAYQVTSISALKEKDDGLCYYKVLFKKGTTRGYAVVNAQSGKIKEVQMLYKTTFKTPQQAIDAFKKKVPKITISDIELDYENKTWVYELEGVKGKYEYEMTLKASNLQKISFDKDLR